MDAGFYDASPLNATDLHPPKSLLPLSRPVPDQFSSSVDSEDRRFVILGPAQHFSIGDEHDE